MSGIRQDGETVGEQGNIEAFDVSVIVCTFNRASLLKRFLSSLAHQTMKMDKYELVIVDDGSEDDTCSVCELFQDRFPNFKYVQTEANRGLAHARNVGIRESSGTYVIFTDDDCLPDRNWIENMFYQLNKHPIVAGAVDSSRKQYLKLCHNIAEFHPFMPGRKPGPIRFVAGANMGYHRSVLDDLSGFHENMRIAQDMELILRARQKGYSIYFVPDVLVQHDPDRLRLKSIVSYSVTHAATTIRLRLRYQSLLKTPRILKSSYLVLLMSPVIAFKVTAGIYLTNFRTSRLFWTMPVVYVLKLAWCWGAYCGLKTRKTEGAISQ